MPPLKVPLIARVECRAESRGEERPIAVTIGGRRIAVVDILERSLVTAAEAGRPVVARFILELEEETVVEVERALPGGDWRCWRVER